MAASRAPCLRTSGAARARVVVAVSAVAVSAVAVSAVAVSAVAVSGCAALPACPARGGPAWIELTTAHFTVRTDLDDAAAHGVITELEQIRASMLSAVWADEPGPPDRVPVIALASNHELSEFTGPRVGGLWIHRPPFPATIVTGGVYESDRSLVLRHELGHHLSRWFLPQQPIWFAEGIASFLETIHYDRERQRAVLGEPSAERYGALRAQGMFPVGRLLTEAQPSAADLPQFEATSWLLVHYLINHREPTFERFQRRLGTFERPQQAWDAELGDLDAGRLGRTLEDYAASGNYTVLHVPVPPWSGPIQARRMSDAEVHGARAFLYAVPKVSGEPTPVERVRAEIAEALSADAAGAIEALAVQYYLLGAGMSATQRQALARRASDAHPQSEMAWLMAADAAQLGDARQRALARALALAPNDAEVLTRMAYLKASGEKWYEAVAFARKSVRLRATSPQTLSILVTALAHTGQCREAAFFVAGVPAPLVGSGPRGPAITAGWRELEDRCLRIAADRTRRRVESPGDGDSDRDGDGD